MVRSAADPTGTVHLHNLLAGPAKRARSRRSCAREKRNTPGTKVHVLLFITVRNCPKLPPPSLPLPPLSLCLLSSSSPSSEASDPHQGSYVTSEAGKTKLRQLPKRNVISSGSLLVRLTDHFTRFLRCLLPADSLARRAQAHDRDHL